MEAATATIVPMDDGYDWLTILANWLSPAYPVGAYSYSHGIEWAVEAGMMKTVDSLIDYIATVLEVGAGWSDLILAAASWRAAAGGQRDELDHVVELGLALRPTREMALESLLQGSAFVATTSAAWPGTALDELATNHSGAIVYTVAVGMVSARWQRCGRSSLKSPDWPARRRSLNSAALLHVSNFIRCATKPNTRGCFAHEFIKRPVPHRHWRPGRFGENRFDRQVLQGDARSLEYRRNHQ